MAFVDLEQAYQVFNRPTSDPSWETDVGSFLHDNVSLFNYDKDPSARRTDGKAAVIAELKAIRDEAAAPSRILQVEQPPYNPAHLEPGGVVVDLMRLGPRPGSTGRRARRETEHVCSDLFKFDEATGLVIEIHYCVTEGHH